MISQIRIAQKSVKNLSVNDLKQLFDEKLLEPWSLGYMNEHLRNTGNIAINRDDSLILIYLLGQAWVIDDLYPESYLE